MVNVKHTVLAAFLICVASAGPASALLTVQNSDVANIQIDAEFPDDHTFEVPEGGTINLIRTPGKNTGGDTYTIKGPYSGTLDSYIERECWRPDVKCSDDTTGGGTRGMDPITGGVKGIKPPK
jgi:hypothetical protein